MRQGATHVHPSAAPPVRQRAWPIRAIALAALVGGAQLATAEPTADYTKAELYPSALRSIVFGYGSVLDASHPLISRVSRWTITFGAASPKAMHYPSNAQIEIEGLVCTHATLGQKECSLTIPTARHICWIMPGNTLQEALQNRFNIDCPSALEFAR
jgi:hypothetical protein